MQLSVLAILVSLLTSVNSLLSLRGNWSRIEFRFFLFLALGQFPAIVFGIELLNFLETNEVWILKVILGSFLVLGGLLSFINPRPLKRLSGRLTVFLAGILGGTLGGLFSASGPVLGLFAYSQPMAVAQIRATLLASFLFTTTARTAVVSFQGAINSEILMLFSWRCLSFYWVHFWARRYPPHSLNRPLDDLHLASYWRSAFGPYSRPFSELNV